MDRTRFRSTVRTAMIVRYRRALRERVNEVDWLGDLGLAARVSVSSVLAAAVYAFSWIQLNSGPTISRADIVLGVACVLSSVGLFAAVMQSCGVRRPWLGGLYVAGMTVLAGVWLILFRGLESLNPTTWMGAAGCAAIIYAMGDGHPSKNRRPDRLAPERVER